MANTSTGTRCERTPPPGSSRPSSASAPTESTRPKGWLSFTRDPKALGGGAPSALNNADMAPQSRAHLTLRSKLPNVGTTIFTVMSRLAAELGAINLSQGFPDFDCDPELVEAVARHMRAGRNQYAPMQGVLALREAISAKYERFHDRRYDPESEVTVTSGGTEAIFDAVAAVVHPGDEAIVLEPC